MSLLGHVAIGVATARRITPAGEPPSKVGTRMVVFAALAFLPDIDFVLQALAPSITDLEHRGATHSLVLAVAVGAFVALANTLRGGQHPVYWGLVAAGLLASHGGLDWLGNSSLGVELLWPFSDARLLAPWHLLPNPGLVHFFSSRNLATLAIEVLVFLPFWLYAFAPRKRPAVNSQA
jgi:inner membrane protein